MFRQGEHASSLHVVLQGGVELRWKPTAPGQHAPTVDPPSPWILHGGSGFSGAQPSPRLTQRRGSSGALRLASPRLTSVQQPENPLSALSAALGRMGDDSELLSWEEKAVEEVRAPLLSY